MRRPKNMPLVLDFAALVVVGVNLPFAVYGYLLFGSATQGVIMYIDIPYGREIDSMSLYSIIIMYFYYYCK